MKEEEMIEKLSGMLTSGRLKHTLGVRDAAEKLAKLYHCDVQKAVIAALLHDCAKNIEPLQMLQMCSNFGIVLDEISQKEVQLIHAPLGAKLAEVEFGIHDPEILEAIFYHTIAKENMSLLTKIIYIADFIEPGRNFPEVNEIRNKAFEDLDEAILLAVNRTIHYVLSKGGLIHPSTINARNYILLHREKVLS